VWLKWCYRDCFENNQDIQFGYKAETDMELSGIYEQLKKTLAIFCLWRNENFGI